MNLPAVSKIKEFVTSNPGGRQLIASGLPKKAFHLIEDLIIRNTKKFYSEETAIETHRVLEENREELTLRMAYYILSNPKIRFETVVKRFMPL